MSPSPPLLRAYVKARAWTLSRMALRQRGPVKCRDCDGRCCTSRYNRMRVTPHEARVIADHLRALGPAALKSAILRLKASVRRYRLRAEPEAQAYTCPFFQQGDHSCGLPFDVKPVGCLAFNPDKEGNCGLDPLLFYPAHDAAKRLAPGEAIPIPVAVLATLGEQAPRTRNPGPGTRNPKPEPRKTENEADVAMPCHGCTDCGTSKKRWGFAISR